MLNGLTNQQCLNEQFGRCSTVNFPVIGIWDLNRSSVSSYGTVSVIILYV